MKKYIPIVMEIEPEIIGVNNGIYQCEVKPKRFTNKNSFDELESFYNGYKFDATKQRSISEDLEIEYCELLKKAILTDFVQFSPYLMGCHFIINSKTRSIFSKFKFGKTSRFIPTNLYTKSGRKIEGDFFMFFQDMLLNSSIDFENSTFYTGHEVTKNKKYIHFKNSNEYRVVLFTETEQIILSDNFDSSLDFFTSRISTCFHISEDMFFELEENKISGFRKARIPSAKTVV